MLRLVELRVSARHEARRPGRPSASSTYPLMVATHLLLFALPPLEIALRRGPYRVARPWLAVEVAAVGLRWWCIQTLGDSWNARGAVPQDLVPVTRGPYRFVRHPNYLAVVAEVLALPLCGGARTTALLLSLLNAAVLCDRIRAEEALLEQLPCYRQAFFGKRRFIPGIF
ncbi:MAG: isoprenylcysteine carboxylmethyltransferase family protein [Candidatus Dormibacteria bacterium]